METYFVRADGVLTDKSLATEALYDGTGATALSPAGLNANSGTWGPGDVIRIEDDDVYDTQLTIAGFGTEAAPIIVRGPSTSRRAQISVSGAQACMALDGQYIYAYFFTGSGEEDGGGDDCFVVLPGSGNAGSGYTIKYIDCDVLVNDGGDGFGIASAVSDTSEAECIRCVVAAVTGATNQGFTCHDSQRLKLTDCETTAACLIGVAPVGAYCQVNGGTFRGIEESFYIANGVLMEVNGATVYADAATTSSIVDVNGASTFIANDCNIHHLAPSTNSSNVKDAGGSATFNGGTYTYSATGTSGWEYAPNGTVNFLDVDFTFINMGARFLRNNAAGGVWTIKRCTVDLSAIAGSGVRIMFESRNTSGSDACEAIGNLWIGGGLPNDFHLIRASVGMVGTLDIHHNTFYGMDGTGNCFWNQLATGTGAITSYNNIFDDCTDPYDGAVGLTKDYNCFSGTTPDEGDANGITPTDPLFVDVATNNFRLNPASPCRGAGLEYWSTPADRPIGIDRLFIPVRAGSPDLGGVGAEPGWVAPTPVNISLAV